MPSSDKAPIARAAALRCDGGMTIPLTEPEIAAVAKAMLALDIPRECLPGVAANLAVLAEHARRLDAAPDPSLA